MKYEEALNYLQDLGKFGINLGLDRIVKLLNLLGDPHKKIKTIHIAGTNGKGSTTAILTSVLSSAGYKVGIYTSPHLFSYTERIKINGLNISKEDFSKYMQKIKTVISEVLSESKGHPTEFEILTALALLYFYENKVDIAVIEVGMGGRLDSTNVVIPEVSVITNISMDHTNYLGTDLVDIAREKGGIIKERVPVVVSSQEDRVKETLRKKALECNAPAFFIDNYLFYQLSYSEKGQTFFLRTETKTYNGLFLSLLGDHQLENAVTAISCLEVLEKKGWQINLKDIQRGLSQVKWPGRLEFICDTPRILLDGAHNPKGSLALSKALSKYFHYDKLVVILGILDDKDKEKMLQPLASKGDIFIITRPLSSRTANWKSTGEFLEKYDKKIIYEEDFQKAVHQACNLVNERDLICITGSLYLIGMAREYVLNTYPQT